MLTLTPSSEAASFPLKPATTDCNADFTSPFPLCFAPPPKLTPNLSQVLPYLQILSRAPSRLWVHALLPRSWAYIWQGSITERGSPALQGSGAAAIAAALNQAALAAARDREGAGAAAAGMTQRAVGGGSQAGVQEEQQSEEEEEEEIESDSD